MPRCDCRRPPEEQKPYPRAIEFPPDRANVALDWVGLESPDPLESCPGYSRPVGLPLTLQLGRLVDTKLTAHSLTEDGKPIEHCAFDADSYRNHIHSLQQFGHWNLRDAGAVVIVPRSPLQPGLALLGFDHGGWKAIYMELHGRRRHDVWRDRKVAQGGTVRRGAGDRANDGGVVAAAATCISDRAGLSSRDAGS